MLAIFAYTDAPFSNNVYSPKIGETIHYPSLLSNYRDAIAPSMFILLIVFTILIVVVLVLRPQKRKFLALALIVVADLGVTYACAGSIFRDRTVLAPIQNIVFDDHRYQLALNDTVAGGWDINTVSYMVFECDPDGVMCQFFKEVEKSSIYRPDEREAVFIVAPADNMLSVKVSDKFKSSLTCITCADS